MRDKNLTRRLRNNEGWSQRQKAFTLKALAIPGFLLYALYQDAKENPKEESTFNKILDKLHPTIIELEFFKGLIYSSIGYGIYHYFQ